MRCTLYAWLSYAIRPNGDTEERVEIFVNNADRGVPQRLKKIEYDLLTLKIA